MTASLLLFAAISAAAVEPPAPPLAHVQTSFDLVVAEPYAEAVKLFGPEGERTWAGPHWNPEFLHPQPGADVEGAVFTIPHSATNAVWVCSLRNLDAHHLQYVYFLPDLLVTVIDVRFEPTTSTTTRVHVVYTRTAITTDGNARVAALSHADQSAGKEWQHAIDGYLASVEKKESHKQVKLPAERQMDFSAFLSQIDAVRAHRIFAILTSHSMDPLVLTGGLAIELHRLRAGQPPTMRPLNDIDFLARTFDDIPASLAQDFLFRHVHPHAPPAKSLMQCVHPGTAVRIDIFRAHGATIHRAISVGVGSLTLRMISLEDLTAYTARISMSLAAGQPLPVKHAQDLLRLLPMISIAEIEPVWREHRKPNHPESFAEAALWLQHLIASRKDLQVVTKYSLDIRSVCAICEQTEAFPLADASRILSLLGYC